MEKFDALDKNGNLTGKTYNRGYISDDVYYGIVSLIVVYNNKILVTKRHPKKPYGLKWEITGGGIISGENYVDATKRELKEETGLEATSITLFDEDTYNSFYCYSSIVRVNSNKVKLQKSEVVDYRWLNIDNFFNFIKSDSFVSTIGDRIYSLKEKIMEFLQ